MVPVVVLAVPLSVVVLAVESSPVVVVVSPVLPVLPVLSSVVPVVPVLPVVPVVPVVDFFFDFVVVVVALLVAVSDLALVESAELSSLLESELVFLLESSELDFLSEPSLALDPCLSNDDDVVAGTLVDVVAGEPSFVLLTLLTTTLVVPKASAIETMANGVKNGGVRYAMLVPPLNCSSLWLVTLSIADLTEDTITFWLRFN